MQASLENGLDRDGFLDVGQIRTVSYQRLLTRTGTLEINYWQHIQQALNIVLGFD